MEVIILLIVRVIVPVSAVDMPKCQAGAEDTGVPGRRVASCFMKAETEFCAAMPGCGIFIVPQSSL